MFHPIKNRKIVLYPDLSTNQKAFTNWQTKSNSFQNMGFDIYVSHLLEEKSTVQQKEHGLDITDFFIINRLRLDNSSWIFNRLTSKNSILKKMVETFDLIIPYD